MGRRDGRDWRAARRVETDLHAAADAHVDALAVALRYAFAKGRKALRVSLRSAEFNPDQPRDDQGQWTGGAGLKDDPSRYFVIDATTKMIPLSQLQTTRARPKGITNAETFMQLAYEGKAARRAPINVKDNGDGTYTALDGNSTTAIARKHGWKDIPAHVEVKALGGAGSGNFGHAGRPGEVGGSASSSGGEAIIAKAARMPTPTQSGIPSVSHQPAALTAARALVAQRAGREAILDALGPDARAQANALFEVAQIANKELTTTLQDVGTVLPAAHIQQGSIKSLDRAIEKVVNKDSGNLQNLRDVVRASIAVDRYEDVPKIVEALSTSLGVRGGAIVQADNKFKNPPASGYRDLQLSVRMPNGTIGEVQVHLRSILALKDNGGGHDLYVRWRNIAEGPTTPAHSIQMAALQSESRALYDSAWKAAGGK